MEDFVLNKNNLNHLFASGQYWDGAKYVMALHASLNGGASWTTSPVTTTDSNGLAVAVDPSDDNTIYIGGYLTPPGHNSQAALFKSTNGGANWTDIVGTVSGLIWAIAVDSASPNKVFAGTSSAIFRSLDGGSNWTKVYDHDVVGIKINSSNPNEVFACGQDGVYISTDGGTGWTALNSGLTDTNIASLDMTQGGAILFAGSYEGGTFRLNRTGVPLTVTISGAVRTSGGQGVDGVTVAFSNEAGTAVTDTNGNYSKVVAYNWSGTATPSKYAYNFTPPARNYTSLAADQINQDYTAAPAPVISLSRTSIKFGALIGGATTSDQYFSISNSGGGTMDWTITDNAGWLGCVPGSGTGYQKITVSVNHAGLGGGTYNGTISVFCTNASNSPQTVAITLQVYGAGGDSAPFGSFDTPTDASTVSGSIAVTGWALDDVEVKKVEIKRDPHADDPIGAIGKDGLVYIGDAVFVKGARPDIESLYPDYPLNDRAGWGYMMLTYGLPRKGNGTFRIHAVAEDATGKRVKLGIKQVTSDNAHRVKPFGNIDTPGQGGPGAVVAGASYINFGWALTPPPNMIPTDASTISVWIDSVNVASPLYNQYRKDIADDFPECLNANGPVGALYLDTTKYANGVHTIGWLVYDNAGNGDGIGSRFFEVQNVGGLGAGKDTMEHLRYMEDVSGRLKTEVIGPREIEIEELERVEIIIKGEGGSRFVGWGTSPDKPLPIGSTLDKQTGVFTWMPAPGFLGRHVLHFAVTDGARMSRPATLIINIVPKNYEKAPRRKK